MSLLDGIRTVRELPVENSRVFIRVDFNVPMQKGVITDDSRIREALPTIKHVMDRGGRVVLASHLGRPKPGKTDGLGMEPCGSRLAELLSCEVLVPDDCIGDSAKKVVRDLRAGQLCLLENLRFNPGEELNDESFARELAELADVYIDDAFGAVHRAHASVYALPRLMRDKGCGFLLEKEIAALGQLISAPAKPYVAVLGGAKVSDKIAVVEALLQQVDALVIGGAMANTFLAARGVNVQASRVEADRLPLARAILEKAKERRVAIILPIDVTVARALEATASEASTVDVDAIPPGQMVLDIGPKTTALIAQRFASARTIFWNGPMGLFENPAFSAGTFGVARAMVATEAFTVIGGGDSAAAVYAAGEGIAAKVKHISTGGGASLELVEGKKLPGIEVLRS
jgi:phosphoglycerate kinase